MREQLFTLLPLDPTLGTVAPGLTLLEAFTRLMAISDRDYMFFRTGAWTMHLVTLPRTPGEPEFECTLSVDSQARAKIGSVLISISPVQPSFIGPENLSASQKVAAHLSGEIPCLHGKRFASYEDGRPLGGNGVKGSLQVVA